MKRIFLFLIVAIFLVFAAGCGTSNDNQTASNTTDTKQSQETLDKKSEGTIQDKGKSAKKEDKIDDKNKDSESKSKSSSDKEKNEETNPESSSNKQSNDNPSSSKNSKSSNVSKEGSKKQSTKKDSTQHTQKQTKEKDNSKSSGKSESKSAKKDKNKSKRSSSNKSNNNSSSNNQKPAPPQKKVTVSVTTGNVKGTVLSSTNVTMNDGDTALDVTLRILKQKGIQYSVRGANSSAYMEGIDNLYEFDEGELSGWHIRVNGKMIDRSAGAWPINEGDSINWNYTTNYLEDSGDW